LLNSNPIELTPESFRKLRRVCFPFFATILIPPK
jgi:hypothetical protein